MTRDGKPVSFSKEFARGMVTEKNQQFSPEQTRAIATRYILGLQHAWRRIYAGPAGEDERMWILPI